MLRELAEIARIRRGYIRLEDKSKIEDFSKYFPKIAKKLIGVELEILQQLLLERVSG